MYEKLSDTTIVQDLVNFKFKFYFSSSQLYLFLVTEVVHQSNIQIQ